jgi:hypothetical protein
MKMRKGLLNYHKALARGGAVFILNYYPGLSLGQICT